MQNNQFGYDYVNQTTLHPLGFSAIMVLGLALLLLPRRLALVPIILSACFIAPAQRVVILTLDFNMLRIMVVFAWARMFLRGEGAGFVWKRMDTVVILWMTSGTFAYLLLHSNTSAVIYKLGYAFDAFGLYFFFRCAIRRWRDVEASVQTLIVVSIPVAIAFVVESATGRNAFAVFGGVAPITEIRQERLRCQGAFSHPIMAGCFWAPMMPLFAARAWARGAARVWGVVGLVTSMVIITTCASSTPLMGVLAGVLAASAFPLRYQMRAVRWCVFATLVGLHLVMNAPVWHLIARVDIVGGSTGWHRYNLIDQAINHVREWWLFGTLSTAHWGWGLYDVTNQYVLEGVRGGLLTLGLFVFIIAQGFAGIGRMITLWERSARLRALVWALGASLFVHCMNFIGVSYFGQIIVVWYLLLAIIASMTPVPESASNKPAGTVSRSRVRRDGEPVRSFSPSGWWRVPRRQ